MKLDLESLNTSEIKYDGELIIIDSPANTDYFNSPTVKTSDLTPIANAPFYYINKTGDFTIKVKVKNNFVSNYDAGAIFVYESYMKWIKLAFERTDFNTNSIVSVITNTHSDDANGANIENDEVWLMVSRKEDSFALHYSLDNKTYFLVRIFKFDLSDTLKVGLLAQTPVGDDATRIFDNFEISDYILDDLRSGRH